MIFRLWMAMLTVAGATFAGAAAALDPAALFLTWRQDPTTTMTIDWHTAPEDGERASTLEYRADGEDAWRAAEGASHAFPYSERTIHRVELTGLSPGAEYEFRFSPDTREFRFRTMPANLVEPLRIAVGGDTRHSQEMMEQTNRVAMRYDPDFIVWGGDLAYANSDPRYTYRWYEWFDAIKNTLIHEDGRVVPIVVAIGNHEVFWRPRHTGDEAHLPDEWGLENHDAAYFYELFAFPPRPGYAALDFADYLSIVLLNSDHGADIEGPQTEWLEKTLAARTDKLHVFPVYHVPAYPSVRDYDGWANPEIRGHWVPLFERYGVKVAFENHDHAYKRTYPILAEAVNDRGIVFIGDGAWGVGEREVHDPEETWYLARAESVRHFILVTIQGQHQHYLMVDADGNVIDEYPETPRRTAID